MLTPEQFEDPLEGLKGPLTVVLIVLILLIFGLVAAFGQTKPDLELPPDLTHITHKGGISYMIECSGVTVRLGDSGQEHDEHVCTTTVKVEYDDERRPWTQPIGMVQKMDHDAALHEANLIGERWMSKIRKAIIEDQHKRGHAAKS
jgi:hypothetical protein